MQWISQARTDIGKRRKINEDRFFTNDKLGIWAVADGMGGHHRGDYASETIIAHLSGIASLAGQPGIARARLQKTLLRANGHLMQKAMETGSGPVASTVVALTVHRYCVSCSWAGDSRIYRFRNGKLLPLTRDHNFSNLLLDTETTRSANGNLDGPVIDPEALTRGVGAQNNLKIEHCCYEVQSGDRYLLCTDGFYKAVTPSRINALYAQHDDDQLLADALHLSFLGGAAKDNMAIVLLSTRDAES